MSNQIDPLNMSDEEFAEKMNNGEFDDKLEEPIEGDYDGVQEEETREEISNDESTEEAMEQPVTDSSDVSEEEVVETETNEDPNESTEEVAEPTEEQEDGTSEEVKDEAKESKDDLLTEYLNSTSKIKAIGKEFEFTNKEKLETFDKVYKQAMDYTKKTQAIAPYRKRISAMEELGMTDDQFNMMLDVVKGDKDAITAVLKQHGVDTLELDTEKELDYVPNSYGKSDKELEIDEAFNAFKGTPEGEKTTNVIASEWDDRSREMIIEGVQLPNGRQLSTSEVIEGLHYDVENGIYDEVAPEMIKLKMADGGKRSDIEYYMEAGAMRTNKLVQAQRAAEDAQKAESIKKAAEAKVIAEAKAKQIEAQKAEEAARKKKAAAVTHGAGGTSKATDYLDMASMSDEEFMAFMEKQIG